MTRGTVTHNPTSLPRLFAPADCNCRLKNLTDLELGALDILGSRRANFKRAICIRAAAMAAQPLINHAGLQQTEQRTGRIAIAEAWSIRPAGMHGVPAD